MSSFLQGLAGQGFIDPVQRSAGDYAASKEMQAKYGDVDKASCDGAVQQTRRLGTTGYPGRLVFLCARSGGVKCKQGRPATELYRHTPLSIGYARVPKPALLIAGRTQPAADGCQARDGGGSRPGATLGYTTAWFSPMVGLTM